MEDEQILKAEKYMNTLETYLKFTKDKNKALLKLFEQLKDLENYVSNKLKQILKEFQVFQKYIQPLLNFEHDNYYKYEKLLYTLNHIVSSVKFDKENLIKSQKDYYRFCLLMERNQSKLEDYVKEFEQQRITSKELQNESKKTMDLKIYSEEAKIKYQQQVMSLSNQWNKLYQSFHPFIATIQKAEVKKRALILAKIDSYIYHSQIYKITDIEFQSKYQEYLQEKVVPLHTKIRSISQQELDFNANQKPAVDFVSFEQFKEKYQNSLDQLEGAETNQDLSYSEEQSLTYILKDIFDDIDSNLTYKGQVKEQDVIDIFKKEQACLNFLLYGQNSIAQKSFIVKIPHEKYDSINFIMGLVITKTINLNDKKVQKVEKILDLLNRLCKIDNNKKVLLCSQFAKSILWKDIQLWVDLFEYLVQLKIKKIKKPENKRIMNFFNSVQQIIQKKDQEKDLQKVIQKGKNFKWYVQTYSILFIKFVRRN